MKSRQIAILAGVNLLVAMSLAGVAQAEPKLGGEIRVATSSDIQSVEPGVRRSGGSDTILHHVTESLVAYDEKLNVAPLVAESYAVSADGLTYTFRLRPEARFHNGAKVTSTEVAWSWARMLDSETGWECANWYTPEGRAKLQSIETPDDMTVVFHLSEPNALFLHYMASIQCITAVLHPDSVSADGKFQTPIGTGPYTLGEWKRGEYVRLQKFEGYVPRKEPASGLAGGRVPYADHIRFVIIPDAATRLAALQSGQVDLNYVDDTELKAIEGRDNIRISQAQGLSWNVLLMQTRDPLLSDVRIRQAIGYAIDLETLVRVRTNGAGMANPSVVASSSGYHNSVQSRSFGYDPAKAKALLAEAGYQGEVLKILANRKLGYMFDTAVVLQAMLKQVGINAELEVLDWATQLEKYDAGAFQLQSFRFSARTDPALLYYAVTGNKEKDPSYIWDTPEAIALVDKAAVTTDPAGRQAIFDELHNMALTEVPFVALYNTPLSYATTTRIDGYEAIALGKERLWGVWVNE